MICKLKLNYFCHVNKNLKIFEKTQKYYKIQDLQSKYVRKRKFGCFFAFFLQ